METGVAEVMGEGRLDEVLSLDEANQAGRGERGRGEERGYIG